MDPPTRFSKSPSETPRRRYSRIAPDQSETSSFIIQSNDEFAIEDDTLSPGPTSQHAAYIPPWTEPYIIGIAGNSGSGKTSLSQKIIQLINQPWTILLSFDNFYNPLSEEERKLAFGNNFDFDHPDSLDLDLLVETVEKLKKGEKVEIPDYSFNLHNRTEKTHTIYGANVIIIEGLYALYDPRLLKMMDLKIYVQTDLDICLARRLTRDILYRGRDLAGAIKQWETFVKPNAVKYLNPTMDNADLVIPRGLDNSIAINLMIKHIENQLIKKSRDHLVRLKKLGMNMKFDIKEYKVHILPNTNQVKAINSILFNELTPRGEFIYFFDRISGLLIELAQENSQEYEPVEIDTGVATYKGLKPLYQYIAISIMRSGDCFLKSIKKSIPDIPLGKLLIQSDSITGEPQLHFESLPQDLDQHKKIMLFDSHNISGAGAIMAIQVLLDHKVKEQDIIFICYLSTEIGIRRILNVFPKINLVIGKLSNIEIIDSTNPPNYNKEQFLDSNWHFRNRFIDSLYFGTD
ncbi:URK1 [[Candida] subhashii]|uniref:Uridine kinase n=1 Tax=[Candida] subhashii TaxID=561895 RepID=A0A8J5UY62_9ASCO|nr:URK1 [[Candida] subhashii]KAG7664130.1 URK1 [[Candida] subhashii]